MNFLDIDIENFKSYIIEAYTKVFGEEYKEMLKDRIERTVLFHYNNVAGMQRYVEHLINEKSKEIAIRELKKMGVNIEKDEYFIKKLNKEIVDEIITIVYSRLELIEFMKKSYTNINAWRKVETNTDLKEIENSKIRFINNLREESKNPITKENFKEFCGTDEYTRIVQKIREYIKIYDKIQENAKQIRDEIEYYKKGFAQYQKYIDNETKRKKDIDIRKINSLYAQLEKYLPEDLKKYLDEKYSSLEEKSRAIFGQDLGIKSYIEYFSKEDKEELTQGSSEFIKGIIYRYRLNYLKNIGIIEENEIDGENAKNEYQYVIQQKDIQKFILKEEIIEKITKLREMAYEETKKEFIYESNNFDKLIKMFNITSSDIQESFIEEMNKEIVCVESGVNAIDEKGRLVNIILFTIRANEIKILDHVILHEMCHSLERGLLQDDLSYCGFEYISFKEKDVDGKNPYNEKWHKYEKLNEIITDMFAIEARKYLHDKGVYILENKDETDKYLYKSVGLDEEIESYNTDTVLKQIVLPFLNQYRKDIVKARMYGNRNIIYEIVGKENFEELNDIVNKVEHLLSQGLKNKLQQKDYKEQIVIEYNEQLQRIKQVYSNMGKYQKHNMNILENEEELEY